MGAILNILGAILYWGDFDKCGGDIDGGDLTCILRSEYTFYAYGIINFTMTFIFPCKNLLSLRPHKLNKWDGTVDLISPMWRFHQIDRSFHLMKEKLEESRQWLEIQYCYVCCASSLMKRQCPSKCSTSMF